MSKHLFVWLGSGRAKKHDVSEKGRLLDEAARARLPVPDGGILLPDFFHLAMENGLVVQENGRCHCPDPAWLHETLYEEVRFPRLDQPAAVRGAGVARLGVDVTDPAQLADALCDVWTVGVENGRSRQDVIIMQMVNAHTGGVVLSLQAQEVDRAQVDGETLTLPHLGFLGRADAGLPPFAQRLQKLLRGLRRTLGREDWQVEWADDGEICWLMQISAA